MQCLQTQQLDLIPLSPKLPGFNTHFGAAFCHVHNQLGIWGDWESEDIAQHCWIFRFPSELPSSLPEHFRRHIPWCNTKAKQTWCFSPVLPGLDEEQVSFPNSHHLLQHKLRWHLHWLHNHPSRDTKHPREPRLLHIELFFLFWILQLRIGGWCKFIFQHASTLGEDACVHKGSTVFDYTSPKSSLSPCVPHFTRKWMCEHTRGSHVLGWWVSSQNPGWR